MKTYSDFKELIDTITWLGSKQEEHRKELELICMASDRTQSVKIELRQKLQDIAADSKSLESYHEDQQKHWTEVYLEDDRKSWTEVHWAAILNKTNLVRLLLKYQPPSERVLRNVQSLIRTEEERTEDYALTLGLLQNPHLVLGPTLQEEPYGKRLCLGIQRQCCEKFDSTILDFYSDKDGRIDFFRKTTSVWKTIYVEEDEEDQQRQNSDVQGGPEAIMDHAIENLEFLKKLDKRGAKEKGKDAEDLSVPELRFRWVHLPANNVSLPRHLTYATKLITNRWNGCRYTSASFTCLRRLIVRTRIWLCDCIAIWIWTMKNGVFSTLSYVIVGRNNMAARRGENTCDLLAL